MEQLAEASGVSVRAISDMERGHSRAPQPRTLAALASALGLTGEEHDLLAGSARAQRMRTVRPRLCEPPRAVDDFIGRDVEIGRITRRADKVIVVHGQPGVGKTALAVHVAARLTDGYEQRLYLDLRGVDPEPLEPGEAARQLLRALDVGPRRIADDPDERCSQIRAELGDRRCLLILDNAADEAQLRPLLPGPGGSTVLITSRRMLGGLEGVLRIGLDPFTPDESAGLLRAIAGQAEDPAAAGQVDEVARLCGHLPLALRIAGTRLATRTTWTVGNLLDRLADADRRLAVLSTGDTGVAAAFALSHAQLSGEGRALFRRLTHVPGLDFAAGLVAVLTGADPHDAGDRLDELVELGLLQAEGADRYRFHDLIRLFAAERLRVEEPAGARAATRQRMIRWLLGTAITAGRSFGAGDDVTDADEAAAWLQAESGNWLGAMRDCGDDQLIVDVAEALHWFADTMVAWPGWYEVYRLSRDAAARLPDPRQRIVQLNHFAWAAARCAHRYDEGAAAARTAYRLAVDLGDLGEQSWALQYEGDARLLAGDHERALAAYRQAEPLAETAGDHDSYLQLNLGIGMALGELGRHEEALERLRRTPYEIENRPVNPRSALAARMTGGIHTARALIGLGRYREALEEGEAAMAFALEFGEPGKIGQVHLVAGLAHAGLGAVDPARADLGHAVALLHHGPMRQMAVERLAAL
ncbi:ATP-, maltotriose-and DNA-dependent transcriptional regulator MalT [Actinoplanes philippinensis]|uniref:ATP-, maltotriose-and DNA-dependent transcriptional regulator MalT n=2 Tax=Actinoplanes philippinensis TaxID=35752 RepID=A0A1I2LTZ0_9ACTN|nr:ATP-, maltotriose-and DNA-dependent transcriptional regulator MalT [Actinoplanes philippinensis]